MWAYLLRRLLWMIPTLGVILMINFAILRIRAPGLRQEMAQASMGDEAGSLSTEDQTSNIAAYLQKFRRGGYHLPAIVNLNGFFDRGEVLARLRLFERGPDEAEASVRGEAQIDLWLSGRYVLEPLAEILADPELSEYHGPAGEAFVYAALRPVLPEEIDRFSREEKDRIFAHNKALRGLVPSYVNDPKRGFANDDPELRDKRAGILDIYAANRDTWRISTAEAAWACLADTGFVDILGKLVTGTLYSDSRKEKVFTLIGQRWQVTLWLNLIAMALAWCCSIPLGIRSARRRDTLEDKATTNTLFLLWSLPSFFVGSLLIYHLCTDYQTADGEVMGSWFPHPTAGLSSADSLWMSTPRYLLDLAYHGVLPLLVLTFKSFTALSRYMRGNLLEQLGSDYVRTARAKGCDESSIVYGHALRNSMVTMITLGSGLLASLFAGFIIVEKLWSLPGLGTLMLEAAKNNDTPLLMGSTLVSVGLLLLGILIADLLYAVVDPRIRSQYA